MVKPIIDNKSLNAGPIDVVISATTFPVQSSKFIPIKDKTTNNSKIKMIKFLPLNRDAKFDVDESEDEYVPDVFIG